MSVAGIEALEARRMFRSTCSTLRLGSAAGGGPLENFTSPSSSNEDVQLKADGKIVVNTPSGVRQFNVDGSVDGTFGTGGLIDTGLPEPDVAVEPDGRIVATAIVDGQIIVARVGGTSMGRAMGRSARREW